MRARDLIENVPDFEAAGGRVASPEGALRDMTVEQVEPNIVVFHSPDGNIFKPAGWTMVYMTDTEQAAADLKAQKIMPPMFLPGTMSMRMGGYAMIDAIWKKRKQRRGEDPGPVEGMRHVVGALEAYVDDKTVYVDNVSTRPGWKRNTVGQKLMQALIAQFPGRQLDHSGTTKPGFNFLKKHGYLKHHRMDGSGLHPGATAEEKAANEASRLRISQESVAARAVDDLLS